MSESWTHHARLRMQQTLPWPAMLERLQVIALGDGDAEASAKRLTIMAWVAGLGLFPGFFGLVMLLATQDPAFIVLGMSGFAGLLAFNLWVQWKRWRAGAKDVENRKLDVAVRLLETLGPEMRRKAPVRLALDFRGVHRAGTCKRKKPGFFSNLTFKSYVYHWLDANFVLEDGTRVHVGVTMHCRRKEKRKRKYTKVRERAWEDIVVDLRAPAGMQYTPSRAQSLSSRRIEIPVGTLLMSAKANGRRASLKFRTGTARTGPGAGGQRFLCSEDRLVHAVVLGYRAFAGAGVSSVRSPSGPGQPSAPMG